MAHVIVTAGGARLSLTDDEWNLLHVYMPDHDGGKERLPWFCGGPMSPAEAACAAWCLEGVARVRLWSGDWASAVAVARKVLQINPESAHAYHTLAFAEQQLCQESEARRHMDLAIASLAASRFGPEAQVWYARIHGSHRWAPLTVHIWAVGMALVWTDVLEEIDRIRSALTRPSPDDDNWLGLVASAVDGICSIRRRLLQTEPPPLVERVHAAQCRALDPWEFRRDEIVRGIETEAAQEHLRTLVLDTIKALEVVGLTFLAHMKAESAARAEPPASG